MNTDKRRFKKISFGTGTGSASILVIFVILCLVSFAALSIVSANADYKLSTKVLNRTTAYYEAVGKAQSLLAQLDQTLADVFSECEGEEAYFNSVGRSKSFVIPISGLQSLEVSVTILYPVSDTDHFYRVDAFRVVTTGELDFDDTLNLIK